MARELSEVLKELDASYNPQRQSINERIAALPAQAEAEIAGLKGQQTQAFDSILSGARSRGLGFSGIPLGEQATYTSSQFLPAVARVRQSQNENQRSLSDALNSVSLDQNKYAQSIRQAELDRDWQREQFERQLAAEERARAAAAKSVARPSFGSTSSAPTTGGQASGIEQIAFNDAYTRLNNQSDDEILSDIRATRQSAGYGNQKDLAKLQVYAQYRPDLFDNPNSLVQRGGGSGAGGKGGGW